MCRISWIYESEFENLRRGFKNVNYGKGFYNLTTDGHGCTRIRNSSTKANKAGKGLDANLQTENWQLDQILGL